MQNLWLVMVTESVFGKMPGGGGGGGGGVGEEALCITFPLLFSLADD